MVRELLGKKIGMTQIFDEEGKLCAVTAVEVGPCWILEEKDYPHKKVVKIGYQEVKKEKKKKKPQLGYFSKLGVSYFRKIKETQKLREEVLDRGRALGADIFSENELVDLTAFSKGRGFQGGMKRHNWRGQPASHGSTTHRRIGSSGASTYPARVVKGHRMPGHMGNRKVTIKNLKILKVDKERNLIFVEGSCPGARNSLVIIRKRWS